MYIFCKDSSVFKNTHRHYIWEPYNALKPPKSPKLWDDRGKRQIKPPNNNEIRWNNVERLTEQETVSHVARWILVSTTELIFRRKSQILEITFF